MLIIMILTTAVTGLLYFGYFQLAPWIWSKNLPIDQSDVTPWIAPFISERDGIELYALYVLMFLNLISVYGLSRVWDSLSGVGARYFLVVPFVVACAFIVAIGFHPPMSTFYIRSTSTIFTQSLTVLIVIIPTLMLLYYLQQRWLRVALLAVFLLLIPVCFISVQPFSWNDYNYIFVPALRLLHGVNISEIYFQYDLLLSLMALVWMRLQLDLNAFQIVGQLGFFILLFSVFVFSRRWFLDKRLSVFLLTVLVLVRIYVGPGEAIHAFQLTPYRLDMWFILLVLVYFKGVHHWSAGIFCGLMLLLHKNFGIIYSAAYLQLLLTLSLMDAGPLLGKAFDRVKIVTKDFIKSNYHNAYYYHNYLR